METGVPQVVALISYILPGYVGLHVCDLIGPASNRTPFHATVWSVFLSLAGAVVASLWVPADSLAHLFGSAPLSIATLHGTGAQTLSGIALGGGYAVVMRHVFKNQLSQHRSAYPTAWDALWSEHGSERRRVGIELANGRYFEGILLHADDPRSGRDLLIREPREWDAKKGAYVSLGDAEFTYFPADQIRRIDVSRATQPTTGAQGHEQVQGRAGQPTDRDEGSKNGRRHVRQEPAQHLPGAEGSGGQRAGEHHQPNAHADPGVARARD